MRIDVNKTYTITLDEDDRNYLSTWLKLAERYLAIPSLDDHWGDESRKRLRDAIRDITNAAEQ